MRQGASGSQKRVALPGANRLKIIALIRSAVNCRLGCQTMLQLKKSVRLQSLRLPFRQALTVASQLGAEGIEINARHELKPAELSRTGVRHLKKLLGDLNLKVAAVHFPTRRGYADPSDLDRRLEATRAAMAMAYDLGCNVVTNRIGQIPSPEDESWSTLVAALTDLGNSSQKSGAWLAAQTGFDEPDAIRRLLDALPPLAIGIDFDPAQMIIGRQDATEAMKQLAASVLHFRARDAVHDLAVGHGLEVQLGRGSVDLPPLLAMLEEQNYNGFITVERDAESDAVQQCGQAIEYLVNLFG